MSGAAVSRDAHWLAYYSGQSGIPEVFVRPFAEGKVTGEAWQISAGGGAYPKANKVNLHVNMLQNWFDELDRRLGPER